MKKMLNLYMVSLDFRLFLLQVTEKFVNCFVIPVKSTHTHTHTHITKNKKLMQLNPTCCKHTDQREEDRHTQKTQR